MNTHSCRPENPAECGFRTPPLSTHLEHLLPMLPFDSCFSKPTDVQLSWFIHSSKVTGVGDLDACTWPCPLFRAASASRLHLLKTFSRLLWGNSGPDCMIWQQQWSSEQGWKNKTTVNSIPLGLLRKTWWSCFMGLWGLMSVWAPCLFTSTGMIKTDGTSRHGNYWITGQVAAHRCDTQRQRRQKQGTHEFSLIQEVRNHQQCLQPLGLAGPALCDPRTF